MLRIKSWGKGEEDEKQSETFSFFEDGEERRPRIVKAVKQEDISFMGWKEGERGEEKEKES